MTTDLHAAFLKVWLGGSLAIATIIVAAILAYDWPGMAWGLQFSSILLPVLFFCAAFLAIAPIGALAWATRRLRRQSLILSVAYAGLVGSVGLYIYLNQNVREVDLDAMYDSKYRPPSKAGAKEEHFAHQFPTVKEIEDYWLDSTLLVSDPSRSNRVFYFDRDYHRTEWTNTYLATESWAISPFQERLKLGSQSRVVTVQCFAVLTDVGNAQRDCTSVWDVSLMNQSGRTSTREHRKGDVFGLSGRKTAPFALPSREPVTINSLLAELQRRSSQ